MKQTCLAVILGAVILVGCKKDKTEDPPALCAAEMVTAGDWSFKFYGEDANDNGTFDFDDIYENKVVTCELDDVYTFFKDGSYQIAPGENTNGCTDQVITGGVWEISGDGKSAKINEFNCTVDSLSEHYFCYHYNEPIDGIVYYSIYAR